MDPNWISLRKQLCSIPTPKPIDDDDDDAGDDDDEEEEDENEDDDMSE